VIFEVAMRLFHTTDPHMVTQRANARAEEDRMKAPRLSEIIAGVCNIVEPRWLFTKTSIFNYLHDASGIYGNRKPTPVRGENFAMGETVREIWGNLVSTPTRPLQTDSFDLIGRA
jgi:hypothetical protein